MSVPRMRISGSDICGANSCAQSTLNRNSIAPSPASVAGPVLLSSAKDVPVYSKGLAPAISSAPGVHSHFRDPRPPAPHSHRRAVMLHRQQVPVFTGLVLLGTAALLIAAPQDAAKLELRRAETKPAEGLVEA